MKKRKIANLPIYPENRESLAPTTSMILDNFDGVSIYKIRQNRKIVKTFKDQLNPVQKRILSFLSMKESDYWKNCAVR